MFRDYYSDIPTKRWQDFSGADRVTLVNISGTPISWTDPLNVLISGSLTVSDLQIGAVEIKDSITDDRVEVKSSGELRVSGTMLTEYSAVNPLPTYLGFMGSSLQCTWTDNLLTATVEKIGGSTLTTSYSYDDDGNLTNATGVVT